MVPSRRTGPQFLKIRHWSFLPIRCFRITVSSWMSPIYCTWVLLYRFNIDDDWTSCVCITKVWRGLQPETTWTWKQTAGIAEMEQWHYELGSREVRLSPPRFGDELKMLISKWLFNGSLSALWQIIRSVDYNAFKAEVKWREYSSSQTRRTAMGTHMPRVGSHTVILPPGRGDHPAFTPANEGWYLI